MPILSKYLGSNNEFENTGIVIIFEGEEEKILKVKKELNTKLKSYNGSLAIKEITIDKKESRLILNASSSGNNNYLYDQLEKVSLNYNLKLSIVSDITVPA